MAKSDKKDDKECNYHYYDVRAGKCKHAEVYNGKVYCKNKNCRDAKA